MTRLFRDELTAIGILLAGWLLASAAFAQPESLQLAEDSRMLAGEARAESKESREECERLEIACQGWIVAVMAVNLADGISFQSTLNVINKTQPVRHESERSISQSRGLENLAKARLAWEQDGDEDLCDLQQGALAHVTDYQGICSWLFGIWSQAAAMSYSQ